jgi:nucleotide-binding universal stress UspA family protein
MKALVYHGPGRKAWETVPMPKLQVDTDAIVRVDAYVSTELINRHPATALLAAASDAALLVVGAQGTNGLTGTLAGSLARTTIHHATCPVIVVPRTQPLSRSI